MGDDSLSQARPRPALHRAVATPRSPASSGEAAGSNKVPFRSTRGGQARAAEGHEGHHVDGVAATRMMP